MTQLTEDDKAEIVRFFEEKVDQGYYPLYCIGYYYNSPNPWMAQSDSGQDCNVRCFGKTPAEAINKLLKEVG